MQIELERERGVVLRNQDLIVHVTPEVRPREPGLGFVLLEEAALDEEPEHRAAKMLRRELRLSCTGQGTEVPSSRKPPSALGGHTILGK